MRVSRTMMMAAAAALLAACGEDGPVANDLNESADTSVIVNAGGEVEPPATVDGSPPANAVVTADAIARPAAAIPAALHGRWGLTPGDCTSTRGDAKGLLTIGPADLRFYESRAVPAAKLETSTNAISGDFAFTGEGQSWTRYQSLELQKDRLARTERDPSGSFSYVRCD